MSKIGPEEKDKHKVDYEAKGAYQLQLKDGSNWNQAEFEHFKSTYVPHSKSYELIMLGFIRHLTIISNRYREHLSEIGIPEGIQATYNIKLQEALKSLWKDPEIYEKQSLEILRAASNSSAMPDIDTSVVSNLFISLEDHKEKHSGDFDFERYVDTSTYREDLIKILDDTLVKAYATDVEINKSDLAKIEIAIKPQLKKILESKVKQIPLINKELVDRAGLEALLLDFMKTFIGKWFSDELVTEVKQDLTETAKSKVKELNKDTLPRIPKAILDQIYEQISSSEVLELRKAQSESRYFINEAHLIDFYIDSKVFSTYPKYSMFITALETHHDAKVIIGPKNQRFITFPQDHDED